MDTCEDNTDYTRVLNSEGCVECREIPLQKNEKQPATLECPSQKNP